MQQWLYICDWRLFFPLLLFAINANNINNDMFLVLYFNFIIKIALQKQKIVFHGGVAHWIFKTYVAVAYLHACTVMWTANCKLFCPDSENLFFWQAGRCLALYDKEPRYAKVAILRLFIQYRSSKTLSLWRNSPQQRY